MPDPKAAVDFFWSKFFVRILVEVPSIEIRDRLIKALQEREFYEPRQPERGKLRVIELSRPVAEISLDVLVFYNKKPLEAVGSGNSTDGLISEAQSHYEVIIDKLSDMEAKELDEARSEIPSWRSRYTLQKSSTILRIVLWCKDVDSCEKASSVIDSLGFVWPHEAEMVARYSDGMQSGGELDCGA